MDELYRIKTIEFENSRIPILMQNRNGPCPLLAISNVLLLRKKLYIHHDLAFIDFAQLVILICFSTKSPLTIQLVGSNGWELLG